MAGKLAGLTAEVEALKAQVALLQAQQAAHVCRPPVYTYLYPPQGAAPLPWYQVVYPGTYIGGGQDVPGGWYFPANVCAGAAAHICAPPVYTYPPQGAAPLPWYQVVYPGTYIGGGQDVPGGWYFPANVAADAVGGTTTTCMLSTAGAQ